MSAKSSSSGSPSSSAKVCSASHGGRPGPAGAGQLLREPGEHPGVADLGGGLHRLPDADAVVALQGDEVDVGAERAGELEPGLLGVVEGVVVRAGRT